MSEIEISQHQRVAVLTMKRPGFGNRITQTMAEELIAALDATRRDRGIAGCVLTGHGDVFCLGGDYQGAGPRIAGRMEFGRAHIDLLDAMARLGKPLVAALNGNAHASGVSLGIGLFAPPFGVGYYMACAIGNVSPDAGMKPIVPYLVALFLALVVLALLPWVSIGFL
jgi:hypothetical protein